MQIMVIVKAASQQGLCHTHLTAFPLQAHTIPNITKRASWSLFFFLKSKSTSLKFRKGNPIFRPTSTYTLVLHIHVDF